MTNSLDSNQMNSNQMSGTLESVDSEQGFDAFLQAQLQQEKPYLADDNFSARVMASLPLVKKSISWRERLIVAGPLMVISILVLTQNSLLAFAIKSWVLLSILSLDNLFKILLTVSLATLLSASFWFAKRCRLF